MILSSIRILKDLDKTQYQPLSKREELQSIRLQNVVKHAYENVSYYKNIFVKVGITHKDIKDKRDLSKIPITRKKDLKALNSEDLLTKGVKPEQCVVKYTSGSTGQPLKLFFSEQERDFQTLLNLRIFLAAGFKLTDKAAYLINPHRFPKKKYWFQYFHVLRRYYLSVFDFPEIHAEAIRRIKPDIVYGYPSNLTLLALLIKEQGIKPMRLKAVFSSAEMLDQKPRELISSALNTEVYDILGLVEIGDIAWECPKHNGYHINSDAVFMEFLDEKDNPVPPGQPGRLVCTSLYGYTMPLIRYDVGDICIPSDKMCSCGRTLPLMESIKGRANDFIVLPDGKVLASCFLVIIMQDFHDIDQYRVIQERRHELTVQIVKGKDYVSATSSHIKKEIERAVRNSLDVKIEIVEKIPRDSSGKIRTVVSNFAPEFQTQEPKISGDFINLNS